MSGDRKLSADTIINEETGAIEVDTSLSPAVSSQPSMSNEEAVQNTRILMDTREMIQSYGLAWFCDGSIEQSGTYKYKHNEKENLIRAWSRVVQERNIKVGPWFDIAVTELMCTGPMFALAVKNRKLRLENEAMKEKIMQMNREKAAEQQSTEDGTPPKAPSQQRRDIKTLWKIDGNGFFEYNEQLQRIPISDRRIKPALTESNYDLLCKHNGKDLVDMVFKLNQPA